MCCSGFPYRERWEATKNLVGGGGMKISSKPRGVCTAIHYTVMVGKEFAGPFTITRGMCQLFDNVQSKPSWFEALLVRMLFK